MLQQRAGAKGRRLDQRAVNLLGCGGKRQAAERAGQRLIDDDAAAAVPPIQRYNVVFTHGLGKAQAGQQGMHGNALRRSFLFIAGGHAIVYKPAEHVAHAALAEIIAVQTRD